MSSHRDWFRPIYFEEIEYGFDHKIINSFVTYGMPGWPSRCEWIVPGTIED